METVILTEIELRDLFANLAQRITANSDISTKPLIYGIPRGGIPVAYRIAGILGCPVTDEILEADIIVDDIVATGKTRDSVMKAGKSSVLFYALINTCTSQQCKWYVFPWEKSMTGSADDIPTRLLEYIGEDPLRDGLKGTPGRFLRAWKFFTKGYDEDPQKILGTTFENEEKYDEIVVLKNIEFYSNCEHHLVPFFGKVHIGYIPDGKVVGISKLARLVECFARRLQIQERMTEQIANAIVGNLAPSGVAVVVEAKHLCMVARGVQKQNSVMQTSSLKGVMNEPASRLEFFNMISRV